MAKDTRTVTLEIPSDKETKDDLTPAERAAEYAREAAGMSDDDAEDFFAGIDELRGTQGVTFQVSRTEPLERAGFCFEYPGGAFTLQRLAKDYGPGVYRIRVKGPGGRYIPGGGTIKVAEGIALDERANATDNSSVQDMLALLRADREKQSGNLKEWAAIIGPLVAPIIANLFVQKKETVADMVGALAALKQLEPPPSKQPDALAEIDRVGALLERAKALAGDSQSSTGATWVDVLRDGLQGVKELIQTGAARNLIPGRAPLNIPPSPMLSAPSPGSVASPSNISPAPSGAAPVTAASSGPVQGGDMGLVALLPWLRASLDSLVYQAQRNKNPELYAEVTLDNLPDGADVRELLKFIEAPDWWQKLQTFAPQVIPYAGWFQEFRDALVSEIKKLMAGTEEPGA